LKKVRSTWGAKVIRDRGGQRVPGSCKVLRYLLAEPRVQEKGGRTFEIRKRNDKKMRDVMMGRNADPAWCQSVIRFFEEVVPFGDKGEGDEKPTVKKVVVKKVQTFKKTTSSTVRKVLQMVARPQDLSDNLRSPMTFFAFGTMRNAGLGV